MTREFMGPEWHLDWKRLCFFSKSVWCIVIWHFWHFEPCKCIGCTACHYLSWQPKLPVLHTTTSKVNASTPYWTVPTHIKHSCWCLFSLQVVHWQCSWIVSITLPFFSTDPKTSLRLGSSSPTVAYFVSSQSLNCCKRSFHVGLQYFIYVIVTLL